MNSPEMQAWWRSAVTYQVYPRSFVDSDGDGVGDIAGIRRRLPYLADLGVDAIWINPWYPSPMADAGYDVSDYRDIEPVFGDLAEADAMISEAHHWGLKVILDIVPNHTSDHHRFFQEALAAAPGSAARDRYYFRPGKGEHGELPPNDWRSTFGGPAWTRTPSSDGRPGEWYLHLFTPGQPDVNWANPDIRTEFEDTLRFWFDRGVDGFRIDVAYGLTKDPELSDIGDFVWPVPVDQPVNLEHPHWDRTDVHQIYREWRAIADEYDPPRAYCGEIWVGRSDRVAAYLRPDELHTAFNFEFLLAPWLPDQLRTVIDATIETHSEVGAAATWVMGNHDVCRPVSRFARDQHQVDTTGATLVHFHDLPADLVVGLRRARAAALLMLALPGAAYIYQGEELGLPEVEDLPAEAMQDPVWFQTDGQNPGRDGCRIPLPWTSDPATNFGFGPAGTAAPWLPQPADWGQRSLAEQDGMPGGVLELYRQALAIRGDHPALGDGQLQWLDAGASVLAFRREPGLECWVNFGTTPVALPAQTELLISSVPLSADGSLPPDATAWLQF